MQDIEASRYDVSITQIKVDVSTINIEYQKYGDSEIISHTQAIKMKGKCKIAYARPMYREKNSTFTDYWSLDDSGEFTIVLNDENIKMTFEGDG